MKEEMFLLALKGMNEAKELGLDIPKFLANMDKVKSAGITDAEGLNWGLGALMGSLAGCIWFIGSLAYMKSHSSKLTNKEIVTNAAGLSIFAGISFGALAMADNRLNN